MYIWILTGLHLQCGGELFTELLYSVEDVPSGESYQLKQPRLESRDQCLVIVSRSYLSYQNGDVMRVIS